MDCWTLNKHGICLDEIRNLHLIAFGTSPKLDHWTVGHCNNEGIDIDEFRYLYIILDYKYFNYSWTIGLLDYWTFGALKSNINSNLRVNLSWTVGQLDCWTLNKQ